MRLLIIFLICGFIKSYGQAITSKIDQKDLRYFIETLSSEDFEGRALDNDGQIKTQEFIINRLKALKINPFGPDGFLEKFTLHQTSRGDVIVETQNRQRLQNFDRMVFTGGVQHLESTPYEIVFGGGGSEEELNRIDVKNRFVLISGVNPTDEMTLKKRLEERQATGLVIFYKDDSHYEMIKQQWKFFHTYKRYAMAEPLDSFASNMPNTDIFNFSPPFCTLVIPEAEVINMMGLSKNKLYSMANKRNMRKLPPSTITVNLEQAEKTVETANVASLIKGESDQMIVVSAHYDHVGKSDNGYFPGADDNASGVAALLELAEEFTQYKKLPYSMLFLATSAEEGGLLGAFYHVNNPGFKPEKVVCNINIDMIARCDDKQTDCNYLYCISGNHSEWLDSLVNATSQQFPACSCTAYESTADILSRSDGYHFRKKEIPSILFFAGFHDDYHKTTDTIDKIDFDILENRVKLIGEFVKLLQKEPIQITSP